MKYFELDKNEKAVLKDFEQDKLKKVPNAKKEVLLYKEMVAKLFLLQFYLFGCVIVRLRKMLFAVAGLRPQNILLVFLVSLENLKFRYEIVLQPSQRVCEANLGQFSASSIFREHYQRW